MFSFLHHRQDFYRTWLLVTRRVSYKKHELLTLREHLGSPLDFDGTCITNLFSFLYIGLNVANVPVLPVIVANVPVLSVIVANVPVLSVIVANVPVLPVIVANVPVLSVIVANVPVLPVIVANVPVLPVIDCSFGFL